MTHTVPRLRIAVLGDDLTGAADAAAPFAGRGCAVSVVLAGELPDDVDVLALVTDSRWRPAEEAAEAVRATVARLRIWRPQQLFLKIDSTLRGRVRDDVAAVLGAWEADGAVATPAFPAQGRTVRDGTLLVHGEPLVPRVVERFPAGVQVRDAETHDDLLAVARDIVEHAAVAVGSGGLARALAMVVVDSPTPRRDDATGADGVLLVVGTTHPATCDQVATLLDAGATPIVLGRPGEQPVAAAAAALAHGDRVVLTCAAEDAVAPDSRAAVALARHIADTVRAVVAQAPTAGLVLTGGATALAVATALGATELRLRGEVSPGLPLGELVAGDRRIPVVTKSGGFGERDALYRAAEALEACP